MNRAPERFWRCVPCAAVIRLTGEGSASPAADLGVSGPLWFAAAQQERSVFFEKHRTHLIELLTQTLPVLAATGPLWDPMTVLRWEVSNSARRFVVEGSRTRGLPADRRPTLDDPLSYGCQPGRLQATPVSVEIPAEDLARIIDEALFPHTLPMRRLKTLTEAAACTLRGLKPEDVEILCDSATDATLGVGRIPEAALEAMIASAGLRAHQWERERLARRLRAARSADELLLTVARRYEIAAES